MSRIAAQSPDAALALDLVEDLQSRLTAALEQLAADQGDLRPFEVASWGRDEGRHGGGSRRVAPPDGVFNRASVNVSQVHYDDLPDKRLSSATALSTIVHPDNPHAPSMHMHISWTEMRDGHGYWRMMADLNPACEDPDATAEFRNLLRHAAPDDYEHAAGQGDRYFFIPALRRTRGVAHFYLEGYRGATPADDLLLARRLGEAVIDGYAAIVRAALARHSEVSAQARSRQLEYHTLYLFQVLTLDRGTTSGLLVHDQNDEGILASLPARVDRTLLATWANLVPGPQDQLVRAIVDVLPQSDPCVVQAETKRALARVVREHYRRYPQALDLQAAGDSTPPTVANHLDHLQPAEPPRS